MGYYDDNKITELIGKTLTEVKGERGDERIQLVVDDGSIYEMYHNQSCCESVSVNDIIGNTKDLIGSPILMAEEISSDEPPKDIKRDYNPECEEWTFYKFATVKGYVTIRWYGTSNGYYSMSVSFRKVE